VFDPRGVPGYAAFKLSILGDAAEDAWAIYSPLAGLRGNMRDFVPLSALTEEQGGDVVEAVLRDLFAEGLIYFFHHATDSVNRDAHDDALRLSEAEAQAAMVDDGWRQPAPTSDVHFTVAAKGRHEYLRGSKR
jgi:hypothetical protein